ncbi:hypothetical protein PCANC_13985 [Puccinia coronata f. sp. avenae]|uniref:CCHC-type domain-containing protein n=1 Tax=Puccinia coronata f. sp. avenae TaxID=200324 RepID=A0A2N5UGY1_9BASI|nr:hypothetical protein PCANC_13985 [Puccinia coronata f. sp. avenae]
MDANNANPALAEIKGQLDQMHQWMIQQEANTSQPAPKTENGDAKLWWFQLARKEGTNKLEWSVFKRCLLEQYNYLYKQLDIWEQLNNIKYKSADQYIDHFNNLIIKLHRDKITNWETGYLFMRNLPPSLKRQVMTEKCQNLEELCASLRKNERILHSSGNLHAGHRGGSLPFINFKKNPSYGMHTNQSFGHQQSFGGHNSGGHSRQPSSSTQVVPMDLDAVDVSKARCYNCNKIGHLSKDCSMPRKIKFGNFPKTGNTQ